MTLIHDADTAAGLIRDDHDLLLDRIDGLSESELAEPYRPHDGPLGHFCDSLHELVAHVLMWSEISLDILHEARSGRQHWSVEPQWETPEVGSALNRAGVDAGRQLHAGLLVARLTYVRDAFDAEIASVPPAEWEGHDGIGRTLQLAMSPPGSPAYAHASLHLLAASVPESA